MVFFFFFVKQNKCSLSLSRIGKSFVHFPLGVGLVILCENDVSRSNSPKTGSTCVNYDFMGI